MRQWMSFRRNRAKKISRIDVTWHNRAASRPITQGSHYSGSVYHQNARHGKGTLSFSDGDVYEGEWNMGKCEGVGTMRYSETSLISPVPFRSYTGAWRADLPTGDGFATLVQCNGDKYQGMFKGHRYDGTGTLTFACGTQVGPCLWKDGCPLNGGVIPP